MQIWSHNGNNYDISGFKNMWICGWLHD